MRAGTDKRTGRSAAGVRPWAVAALLVAASPAALAAQGILEQFSYEGLRFSGFGIDAGAIWSDRLETEATGALRVDYGFFAPGVRTMLGVSYFRSRFDATEIRSFEDRLNALVSDPDVSITVGEVTWTNVSLDLDLQYLFGPARRITPYAGLGLGVHIRNGSGAAIDGTFVEDALDTVAAGLNGMVGAEATVAGDLRVTTEVRGVLTSELLGVSIRGGLMLRLPRGTGS